MAILTNVQNRNNKTPAKSSTVCSDNCETKNKNGELSSKLTTPELRKRKETIIKSLKKQILERKELNNGYSYKFIGTDKMLDELAEFAKTERVCCDFFVFNLLISGNMSETWLEITAPKGAKKFIVTELQL